MFDDNSSGKISMTLTQKRCIHIPCGVRTPLAPYCAKHAHRILGLALKPGRWGCALHTTRKLKKGDVIATYIGEIWNPAQGDKRPYAMSHKDGIRIVDATVYRSWAAMANHRSPGNVIVELLNILRNIAGGKTGRVPIVGSPRRCVPTALLQNPFLEQEDIPFMVAIQDIPAGDELLLDYGVDAEVLNNIRHRTTPSLCGP